jgi:hypothetical protein
MLAVVVRVLTGLDLVAESMLKAAGRLVQPFYDDGRSLMSMRPASVAHHDQSPLA